MTPTDLHFQSPLSWSLKGMEETYHLVKYTIDHVFETGILSYSLSQPSPARKFQIEMILMKSSKKNEEQVYCIMYNDGFTWQSEIHQDTCCEITSEN